MIPHIIMTIEDQDDRAFMEDLYLSYKWVMYSQIKKLVSGNWEAEDILQSALVKLIGKIALLKTLSKTDMINYIITTCRREAISFLRKSNPVDYMENENLDAFECHSETPEMWILTKERFENTYKAWQMLDENTKMILIWKYKLEMSDAEIAEELGIKPGSVRMRMTRARNNFKQKIQELE